MATRIYFPSTGSIPAGLSDPTFGTWTETTGADRLGAVTTRISSAMTNKTQGSHATGANNTWLDRQYSIGPLAAQTFGVSTVKGTIRALESAVNDNVDAMRLIVRVVAPDGTTFRGTIYGPTNGTVAEFNTSLRAKRLAVGGATTSVAITEGDYLVIDIGATATTGGASISTTINYGDNSATDLGDNETDVAANNPFIELAGNMKFLQKGFGQANADIKVTDRDYAQAQAYIKAIGVTGFAQAQAYLPLKQGYGQAQAVIAYTVVVDEFGDVNASNLGDADVGGTYGYNGPTIWSTDGTVGNATLASSQYPNAHAYQLRTISQQSLIAFKFDKIPTPVNDTTWLTVSLNGRVTPYTGSPFYNRYSVVVRLNKVSDDVMIAIYKDALGSSTNLAGYTAVSRENFVANIWYWIRAEFSGVSPTTIKGKIWQDGTVEPSSFDITTTDSEATLQNAGGAGFNIGSDGASNYPIVASIDHYNVNRPSVFGQAAALITHSVSSASDTFTRTESNGWGTANAGGNWVIAAGTASDFSVDGTSAQVSAAGSSHSIELGDVLLRNTEQIITYSFPDIATSKRLQLLFNLPSYASSANYPSLDGFSSWVDITLTTGAVSVTADLVIPVTVSAGTYVAGETWYLKSRWLATSGQISAYVKSWKVGTLEPGWQASNSFTTSIIGGHVGITVNQTVTLDNYNAYQAFPVGHGQAQAKINAFAVKGHGQARALIPNWFFGQANALINGTFTSVIDTFTRSVTDGMGTADTGGAWIVDNQPTVTDIDGSQLVLSPVNTNSINARLSSVILPQNYEGIISIKFAEIPAAGFYTFALVTQLGSSEATATKGFAASITFFNDGSTQLDATYSGSGTSVGISNYQAGNFYYLKFRGLNTSSGATLSVKAWKIGDSEPGWQTVLTRSVATPPGHVGFWATLRAGITVLADDLNIYQAFPVQHGQAQANIKAIGVESFGQAQTRISSVYERAVKRVGPSSYWKLDETTGTTTYDQMGAEDGTLSGNYALGYTPSTVLPDKAIDMSTTGVSTLGTSLYQFTGTASFSIIFWMQPHDFGGTKVALSKIVGSTGWSIGTTNATGTVRFIREGTFADVSIKALTDEQWSFIAVVYNGSTGFAHVDDVKSTGTSNASSVSATGSTALLIGGVGGSRQEAAFDEVAIFSSAISYDDIQALYTIGKSGATVRPGQAQAQIKQTYRGYGQAQALIVGAYTYVNDTFTRSVPSGWGNSDIGGTWTLENGTDSLWNVNGSVGFINDDSGDFLRRLNQVSIGGNVSIKFKVAIDAIPGANNAIIIYWARGSSDGVSFGTGVRLLLSTGTGNLGLARIKDGSATTLTTYNSYTPNDTLQVYFQWVRTSNGVTRVRGKIWKVGTTEPEYTTALPSTYDILPGHVAIYGQVVSEGYTFDDLEIVNADWTESGQAQAYIVNPNVFGQAQAKIQIVAGATNVYAQAQADIKATSNSFAQSQGDIKQKYNTFAQAQADIQQTYNAFAQAQSDIKQTYRGYGQAQADIKQTYQGYAQSQADIKQTYRGYGQAQAQIKQTYRGYAQAQADIKQTYRGYGQAQACIKGNAFGQAQAGIKQVYQGYAQAQADIKATSNAYAQAQGTIKTTYNAFAQANADIKTTYQAYAQAQADIKVTTNQFAQAQAWIEATVNQFAQAQADIKATSNSFAQAQAKMNAFGVQAYAQALSNIKGIDIEGVAQAQAKINAFGVQGYGQAQADIKQTYNGFGQAQARITNTYNAFAQAQADTKTTYNSFAQAQADIKATSNAFAQSQADIKTTYRGYAQVQSDIKATYNAFAQSQAQIKQTYNGYGQAQACIKGNAFGQAQADIKQVYYGFGQAQADIKATYFGFAQANADIEATVNAFAQAQADIKSTYQTYGQAQADIKAVSNAYSQAQADIKTTYQGYAQAQADIKVTTNAFAQAQSDIKQVYQGYAQAQAEIKQTYQGYGQGQALIVVNDIEAFAQAQADIKVTTNSYAQVQANIKQTYQSYAQAQTDIKATYNAFAQAQADILTSYQAYAQAQADIKQTYNGYAQSQADIKATYQSYAQVQAKLNSFDYEQFAQAQALIQFQGNAAYAQAQAKLNSFGYCVWGQTQADIKATYRAYAQAQAEIKQTYNAYAQAQADILQTYQGYGQAQADIKATYQAYAQSQALIVVTNIEACGQAQADIKQTYQVYAQAGAWIEQTYQAYAQAQAQIKQTYQGYAQSQALIVVTDIEAFAQAQADILQIYYGFAQAQTNIKATSNGYGQANCTILGAKLVYAQAQGTIKATSNGYGQCQADIKQTYQGYGQSQADILRTEQGYGQSNALIVRTAQNYGQANSDIKATSNGYGQAQGDILQTYQSYAQAQARIKQTYQAYGQAQAYIYIRQQGYGQAQGTIEITTNSFGQAQADILATYVKCGQAQALIKTTAQGYGQAQGQVNAAAQKYGQAQATITNGSVGYGQAQGYIIVTDIEAYAQAQAFIIKSAGYGQARAVIFQTHTLKKFSISDRASVNLTLSDRESRELQEVCEIALTLCDREPLHLTISDRVKRNTI